MQNQGNCGITFNTLKHSSECLILLLNLILTDKEKREGGGGGGGLLSRGVYNRDIFTSVGRRAYNRDLSMYSCTVTNGMNVA